MFEVGLNIVAFFSLLEILKDLTLSEIILFLVKAVVFFAKGRP
jgi:hypothetical protein